MLVLVGESGSGKNTILNELIKLGYRKVVTYTTRKPRDGEVEGEDYHFVSISEFFDMRRNGAFVETATYNHWYYGTTIEDCTDDDKAVIILTPRGLRSVKKLGIKCKSAYITTNRATRLIRILKRGDNVDECIRRNMSDEGMFDGVCDEVDIVITYDDEDDPALIAKIITM